MQSKPATRTKRGGLFAMLGAFFILLVSMFSSPFVEQKKKDTNADVTTQKTVVRRTAPLQALLMFGIVSAAVLAAPAAADINWTDIDAMFDGLVEHLIPNITAVISASTSLIITIVVVIVVIAVTMFFPELLFSILDSLKDAMRFNRK